MLENNHIIKKIALQLDLTKNLEVATIRSELMQTFKGRIKDELLPFMDELCDKDEVVRIERLNIDLGEIPIDDLYNVIGERLKEELEFQRTKIQAYKVKQSLSGSSVQDENNSPTSFDGISIHRGDDFFENGFKTTASNRKVDGLIDFFKTGARAWWNPLKNQLEIQTYLNELSSGNDVPIDAALADQFREIFGNNENALIRFVSMLSVNSIDVWIKAWSPNTLLISKRKDWAELLEISKLLLGNNPKEIAQLISIVELKVLFNKKMLSTNGIELLESILAEFITTYNAHGGKGLFSQPFLDRLDERSKNKAYSPDSKKGIVLNVLKSKLVDLMSQHAPDRNTNKSENSESTGELKGQFDAKSKAGKEVGQKENSPKSKAKKGKQNQADSQEDLTKLNSKKDTSDFESKESEKRAENDRSEQKEVEITKSQNREDEVESQNTTDSNRSKADENKNGPAQINKKGTLSDDAEKARFLNEEEKGVGKASQPNKDLEQKQKAQGQSSSKDEEKKKQAREKDEQENQALTERNEKLKKKATEDAETARLVKRLIERNELSEQSLKSAFFNAAGVVIVWPLIVPLFDDRGLLEDRQFKDNEAQFKGLELLNYLVAGDAVLDEYDMVLNKVLCGIPIEATPLHLVGLSDEDKEEVENLLNHLIKHWSILKNTSINGLREGFILREAELNEFEEHWLLKVEQKGIDILMNKIPWGYKTVKLPWMSKIISVEW